jgi:hypothetical protein
MRFKMPTFKKGGRLAGGVLQAAQIGGGLAGTYGTIKATNSVLEQAGESLPIILVSIGFFAVFTIMISTI